MQQTAGGKGAVTATRQSTPWYGLAVLGIVALSVALRVWFWSWQATSGAVQPGDPEEYYRAAVHLLQGGYHDTGKWLRPPVYPLLLAGLFAVGGLDVAQALLGQAILSGVGVLAFVALGQALFQRRDVALLSGLFAASFVPLASFGSVLFAEALFVILMTMALTVMVHLIEKPRLWLALAGGIIFGFAALTRATALYFIPLAAMMPLVLTPLVKSEEAQLADRTGWQWLIGVIGVRVRAGQRWAVAVMLVVGAALIIGPWALRNYLVHERMILADTNGGISMWYGMVRGEEDRVAGEALIFAEPNLADRQKIAVALTVERIQEDPAWFALRTRLKLASLFLLQSRSFFVGDVVTISPQDEQIALSAGENPRWLSLIADAQYIFMMLAGIVGLAFAPHWRRSVPLMTWFAYGVALSAITVAHHRLRLPLISVFLPFAAYAALLPFTGQATRLVMAPSERRLRLAIVVIGWLIFFALIFSTRYLTWAQGERAAWPARAAIAQGDWATAEMALLQAAEIDASNANRQIALGDFAFERGDLAKAETHFAAAVALEDRSLYAHAMRAWIAVLAERPTDAEASLARIASYGRDNNDLYAWAWHARRTPAATRVVPGAPAAFGHYRGFAPTTFDLAEGRWTLGEASVRVAHGCNPVEVSLRGPEGRMVEVALHPDGERQNVRLDGSIQVISLAPDPATCDEGMIGEVVISSPTSLLDLEQAPWAVGVQVLLVEAR